jgi:20S proteasome alpha/beta subunit
VAFAVAGDVSHATMAVQEIIRDLRSKSEVKHEDIETTVKARVEYIYEHLLYPHPRAGFFDAPFFDLIGAVYTNTDGCALLVSAGASVVWEAKYACRGIGLTLAEYLIKPLYSLHMSRAEIESLAAYMLSHVKETVSGCGGESEFLILDAYGSHMLHQHDRTEHEDFTEVYDAYLPMVFSYAGDLEKPDDDVRTILSTFADTLMHQREEFRKRRSQREAALEKIRQSKARAQQKT